MRNCLQKSTLRIRTIRLINLLYSKFQEGALTLIYQAIQAIDLIIASRQLEPRQIGLLAL